MFKEGFKWVLCIYIAFVFVQSLFFKFTDAYETVYIFSVLGNWSGLDWFAEYGAYGVGITELIAAILLMIPASRLYGAILSTGVMAGAVFFHLFTPLGINMPEFDNMGNIIGDDGGLLFYNASGMLVAAIVVAILEFIDTDNAIKRIFS
ncbi:MAG: DoxX family protein [Endozoicomonas sp.]|uniref:DoxX family protein n=1 Tax=Endozoicomonas sp. TaxID=1892382 RepID=UPI003D9AC385